MSGTSVILTKRLLVSPPTLICGIYSKLLPRDFYFFFIASTSIFRSYSSQHWKSKEVKRNKSWSKLWQATIPAFAFSIDGNMKTSIRMIVLGIEPWTLRMSVEHSHRYTIFNKKYPRLFTCYSYFGKYAFYKLEI